MVMLVAPPKTELTFSNEPEQVALPPLPSIVWQIFVRSTVTPPIGVGALILLPFRLFRSLSGQELFLHLLYFSCLSRAFIGKSLLFQ